MPDFEGLVDRHRAQIEQLESEDPECCDLCGVDLNQQQFFVDGETRSEQAPALGGNQFGEWANMCASCFSQKGIGIGWGTGQLYERAASGVWLMVAGFPERSAGD